MPLYIHVPFCARRCSYCDFAIAVRRGAPVEEYLEALQLELSAATPSPVETIYFGGGTPSQLGADGVAELLGIVRERYRPEPGAEITLEANPDDVTADAARAWLEAGVTRLSLGLQSFDDRVLQWMHRTHDAETAARSLTVAREAGFSDISLDLIFALPAELARNWRSDLDQALALDPAHVSLYGLTVEPATPLARWRDRGVLREAPDEQYETEYLLAHDVLTAAGFEHYEVSNFARPGSHSRHNRAYWSLEPYAAHGPAAHRFDGRRRSWNEPVYTRWLQRLHSGLPATVGFEDLTPEQRLLESAYLGLRSVAGYEVEPTRAADVERWVEAGWARTNGRRVTLTATGWLRLDALTSALTGAGSPCNV